MDIYGDITPPRPLRALLVNPGRVTVEFNEPLMRQSACSTFNYSFRSLLIRGASLQSDGRHNVLGYGIKTRQYAAATGAGNSRRGSRSHLVFCHWCRRRMFVQRRNPQ